MKYDEIGEWSEIKLEIIKKYAGAYTTILGKQEWCRGWSTSTHSPAPGRHAEKPQASWFQGPL